MAWQFLIGSRPLIRKIVFGWTFFTWWTVIPFYPYIGCLTQIAIIMKKNKNKNLTSLTLNYVNVTYFNSAKIKFRVLLFHYRNLGCTHKHQEISSTTHTLRSVLQSIFPLHSHQHREFALIWLVRYRVPQEVRQKERRKGGTCRRRNVRET